MNRSLMFAMLVAGVAAGANGRTLAWSDTIAAPFQDEGRKDAQEVCTLAVSGMT